jgi:hypothetical protein
MRNKTPALRISTTVDTISGADDSVKSINTTLLDKRAIVACAENNSLYMLRKESTATESLPDIVAPNGANWPGRWYLYPAAT